MSQAWTFSAGEDAGLDSVSSRTRPHSRSIDLSIHPISISPRLSEEQKNQIYMRGLEHFRDGDYVSAYHSWLEAAREGHAAALCDLGYLLGESSFGVKRDDLAFLYSLLSAQRGYSRAQNNVGLHYRAGRGCERNAREAVRWLEAAKAAGYPNVAIKALEECRAELDRMPRNAPEFPVPDSTASSAKELYEQGLRCFKNKDILGARDLWEKAAALKHPIALCDLGWLVGGGYQDIIPRDPVRGFELTKASAELGFARAANNLGLYYFRGTGCKEDMALAVHWLEVAEKAKYERLARKTLREARVRLEAQRNAAQAQTLAKYRRKVIESHDGHIARIEQLKEEYGISEDVHQKVLEEAGLPSASIPTSNSVPDGPRVGDCLICMDKPADYCLLWCMHVCLCEECSAAYTKPGTKDQGRGNCPACRSQIKKVKKIFF